MAAGTEPPDLEERVAALEAAVAQLAQPEPEFMSQVRAETFRSSGAETVHLLHLPTGVRVESGTRPEAIAKLGRALERYARRHSEGTPSAP